MRVFIDFEASSLSKWSYPIEVGWIFEDGREADFLIRPAPAWTDWDASAEAIHGLSRERLEREGTPHEIVCDRLVTSLGPHTIYASSPPWDGRWLSMLLRAAGRPRHLLRLRDSEEAFVEAARERLGADADEAAILALIADVRARIEGEPVAHRALADARREWAIWRALRAG
ncbi:MAG TPA: transcriptional regulator [Alphaproteobacteria bacterium]|nr:transcriptional regulator [Alphaproteobacteria bacterium]